MPDQDAPSAEGANAEPPSEQPPTEETTEETQETPRPHRFRAWRRSRPFWGGLFSLIGGLEIATIPLTAYRIILVSHSVAIAAVVGAVIAILGLMLWLTPAHNKLYGLLIVLLAIVSFVTSNVGGFLLGGLLALIGGALGFAWVVVTPAQPGPATPPAPAVDPPAGTEYFDHEAGQV